MAPGARLLWWASLCLLCAGTHAANAVHQAERLTLTADSPHFMAPPPRIDVLPDTGWQRVSLPDVALPRDGQGEGITTTWYRLPVPAPHDNPTLYLPRWQTVGQVAIYGDGVLLWRSSGDLVWNGFNRPVWLPLTPLDGRAAPGELLIRMDSVTGLGGGLSRVYLDDTDALIWRYRTRLWLQAVLPGAIALVFLTLAAFGLSLRHSREDRTLSRLFLAAALLFALRGLHFSGPLDTRLMSSDWFGWLTVNALLGLVLVSLLFNLRLCQRRLPWLEYTLGGSLLLALLTSLPLFQASEQIVALAGATYGIALLLSSGAFTLVAVLAWRSGIRSAQVLATCNLIGLPLAAHDLLLMQYQINLEHPYLLVYWEITFCLLFSQILYRRYRQGVDALEHHRRILADTLARREQELDASYRKLREVEQRELLALERQRLMRDMHDGLGATLTNALHIAQQHRGEDDTLTRTLQEGIDELRQTLDSLTPVGNDLTTSLATLRYRLQPRLEAAGLTLHWSMDALPAQHTLTAEHIRHVLSILQEAITNILKHNRADTLHFSTRMDHGDVLIELTDNGTPFSPQNLSTAETSSVERRGRGLTNILSRAATIQAKASWQPDTVGTRFTLRVPGTRPTHHQPVPHQTPS
ncbi:sensor histidine kinase [Isoalcanivorax indicus]|uniref:sensor histidine kinase n=1 Tax=Isoalcanivorax indicus TaxID=2202653 RepID=UPI000DBA49AD|nr:ATP-binding protein [Isoalcanivorax indicus]